MSAAGLQGRAVASVLPPALPPPAGASAGGRGRRAPSPAAGKHPGPLWRRRAAAGGALRPPDGRGSPSAGRRPRPSAGRRCARCAGPDGVPGEPCRRRDMQAAPCTPGERCRAPVARPWRPARVAGPPGPAPPAESCAPWRPWPGPAPPVRIGSSRRSTSPRTEAERVVGSPHDPWSPRPTWHNCPIQRPFQPLPHSSSGAFTHSTSSRQRLGARAATGSCPGGHHSPTGPAGTQQSPGAMDHPTFAPMAHQTFQPHSTQGTVCVEGSMRLHWLPTSGPEAASGPGHRAPAPRHR